ncbi:MAG: thioredoxin domain-containing protein [Candidatus Aenigmatarchaeota archaeon]
MSKTLKIKINLVYIVAILIVSLVLAIVLLNSINFSRSIENQLKLENLIDENDVVLGNISSKIILIEYSSFDCPACRFFHLNYFDNIEDAINNNEIVYVLRLVPLKRSELSIDLIKVAYCSMKLKNSLETVKYIFKNYANITSIEDIYNALDYDISELKSCVNSIEAENYVKSSYKKLIENRIEGTPTFVLVKDGEIKKIVGAQPINLN